MPKLTAAEVKNAPAAEPGKRRKMYDERGLILMINDKGAKWWLYRYTVDKKRKHLNLGSYPSVGLADARLLRDKAAIELAGGSDPGERKASVKAAVVAEEQRRSDVFRVLAKEWHTKKSSAAPEDGGWTAGYAERVWSRLVRNVFPVIGDMPMDEIDAGHILDVLRPIEQRGTVETAFKCHAYCSSVFRFAIPNRRAKRNPCADFRPGDALGSIPNRRHFAAITEPDVLGEYLRSVDGYIARIKQVEAALRVMPHVFVRPKDLRGMAWADLDFGHSRWKFEVVKGKVRSLIVPLSRQVLELLEEIRPYTGGGERVFPGLRSRDGKLPISENTLNDAMRAMGWGKEVVSSHGFRATARTLLEEELGYDIKYIEMQLAHVVKDSNGTAYNRTKFLKERAEMMQAWSDYLDRLRAG